MGSMQQFLWGKENEFEMYGIVVRSTGFSKYTINDGEEEKVD